MRDNRSAQTGKQIQRQEQTTWKELARMNNPAFQGTSARPQRTFITQTFTSRTLDRRADRITAVAAQISKDGACDGAVGAPSSYVSVVDPGSG